MNRRDFFKLTGALATVVATTGMAAEAVERMLEGPVQPAYPPRARWLQRLSAHVEWDETATFETLATFSEVTLGCAEKNVLMLQERFSVFAGWAWIAGHGGDILFPAAYAPEIKFSHPRVAAYAMFGIEEGRTEVATYTEGQLRDVILLEGPATFSRRKSW